MLKSPLGGLNLTYPSKFHSCSVPHGYTYYVLLQTFDQKSKFGYITLYYNGRPEGINKHDEPQ